MKQHIGILGHSIEYIKDHDKTKRELFKTIDLLKFQYGESLIINVDGNVGIGHWVMQCCLDLSVKYQIFLSSPVEICGKYWYKSQQEDLNNYYNFAWASVVCSSENDNILDCYKMLANNSNFLLAFWIGKKKGNLFDCINHCLESNRMVINGFSLKMIIKGEMI